VRDGAAVVAAPEFVGGAAVMRLRDGTAAKGLPFRFGTRPPIARGPCPPLGADNLAVLAAAGLTEAGTEALEAAGVLVEAPRAGS